MEQRLKVLSDEIAKCAMSEKPEPPPPASPLLPPRDSPPRCQLPGPAEDGAQKNDEMSAARAPPGLCHPGAEVDVPDLAVPVTELADRQAVDLKACRDNKATDAVSP